MKVTLLGHASVLVELEGANCLMDPVFFDPFEEGAVVSCPKRSVFPERLPQIDVLIVSHRHPDHFDIASLALVNRDCDAICPADALIVYALKQLGFSRVTPVNSMAPIISTGFELYPTRSEAGGVTEFGMVFQDRNGTFWNQVDTSLSAETIRTVKNRFGQADLLFAMYASQNFEFFDSLSASFPFDTHRENLQNVLEINPRMAAPGSAGFRFSDSHAWLNRFLFPISRERFVADLKRLAPEIATAIMNPGDVFEIQDGKVRHLPAASNIAVTEEDDTGAIRFNPAAPVPELTDPNEEDYSIERLVEITEDYVANVASFVLQGYQNGDRIVNAYRENLARYEIDVVFPEGGSRRRLFEFGKDGVRLMESGGTQEPGMVHRIAASALAGWVEHKKSFFYVRAYSRRYGTLYTLSRENGKIGLRPKPLPDLLMHYLLNVAEGSETAAKRQVDMQIRAALRENHAV